MMAQKKRNSEEKTNSKAVGFSRKDLRNLDKPKCGHAILKEEHPQIQPSHWMLGILNITKGKCLYWSMKKYSVGMLRFQSIPEIAEIQCSSKHSKGHTGGKTASSLMLLDTMHSHAVESAIQNPHSRVKQKTAAAAHGLLDVPGIRCSGRWHKAKQLIKVAWLNNNTPQIWSISLLPCLIPNKPMTLKSCKCWWLEIYFDTYQTQWHAGNLPDI